MIEIILNFRHRHPPHNHHERQERHNKLILNRDPTGHLCDTIAIPMIWATIDFGEVEQQLCPGHPVQTIICPGHLHLTIICPGNQNLTITCPSHQQLFCHHY